MPAPGEREKAYKFKGATKHNWLVTVRHPDAVVRFASVTRTGDRIREVLRLAGKWSYPLRRGRFMLELDWSSIIEVTSLYQVERRILHRLESRCPVRHRHVDGRYDALISRHFQGDSVGYLW